MMSNMASSVVKDNEAKGDEIKKASTRQRRKSRDLEQEVFGMHITDKAKLKKVFDEIDTVGSTHREPSRAAALPVALAMLFSRCGRPAEGVSLLSTDG